MTEQDQYQPSLEDVKLAFDGQSVDWYLQKLVGIANTSDVQFGVTLFVEGIVISGQLVSGKRYFEAFAQEFSAAYPGGADEKRIFVARLPATPASTTPKTTRSRAARRRSSST